MAKSTRKRSADLEARKRESGAEKAIKRYITGLQSELAVHLRGRAYPVAQALSLTVDDVVERLGSPEGEVRRLRYGDRWWESGHWALDDTIDVMYREGRLEVRASLPKVLLGRNDVVLNDRGVHVALRKLVARVGDALEYPFSLRDAAPNRIDYAIQWQVPSVAAVLEHLRQTYKPSRKRMSYFESPRGGRTLWYGQKSKHSLRFYDKVGERLDAGVTEPSVELDWDEFGHLVEHGEQGVRKLNRLLRYEVQDRRRRGELRRIHERGYRAADARAELEHPIRGLLEVWTRDLGALIDESGGNRAIARVLAGAYLAEHPEALTVIGERAHRNVRDRWKREAQRVGLALHSWQPIVPRTAFVAATGSLWDDDDLEAAA